MVAASWAGSRSPCPVLFSHRPDRLRARAMENTSHPAHGSATQPAVAALAPQCAAAPKRPGACVPWRGRGGDLGACIYCGEMISHPIPKAPHESE